MGVRASRTPEPMALLQRKTVLARVSSAAMEICYEEVIRN